MTSVLLVSCAFLTIFGFHIMNAMPDMEIRSMDWSVYKSRFGKMYKSEVEDNQHRQAFELMKTEVIEHNAQYRLGKTTYWKQLTKFSDMLPHEKFTGRSAEPRNNFYAAKPFVMRPESEVPDAIDWRLKGWVTPVKDQKHCGACYAFSSVGALESQHKNVTGELIALSEQNAVDCTRGCAGGQHRHVYQYIIENKGIDTQDAYPYKEEQSKCSFQKSGLGATMSSYVEIAKGDETALTNAVGTVGPVAVAITALSSFEHYAGGVYYEENCDPEALNHEVVVVGYNTTEDGQDYYIIKNSWGTENFGMKGYAYMARNKKNNCGIATDAAYPVV